eukprot:5167714-Amphidinium_carterae.2
MEWSGLMHVAVFGKQAPAETSAKHTTRAFPGAKLRRPIPTELLLLLEQLLCGRWMALSMQIPIALWSCRASGRTH